LLIPPRRRCTCIRGSFTSTQDRLTDILKNRDSKKCKGRVKKINDLLI
jgi:hypothetical protein